MCSEQSFYVIVIKAWWKETPSANSLLYLCAPAAIIMDIMTISRLGNSHGGSKQTNGRNVPCPLSSPANTNPATIRTFQIMALQLAAWFYAASQEERHTTTTTEGGKLTTNKITLKAIKRLTKKCERNDFTKNTKDHLEMCRHCGFGLEYVCTMYHIPPHSLLVMSNDQPLVSFMTKLSSLLHFSMLCSIYM
jgi:hypothetical protein